TVAVLGALQERQRSGLGQFIDVALLDCHVAMLANQNLNYMTSGVAPTRAGNAHQNVVPYQVFAASDGHLIVAIGNDSQYRAYCQVMGRSDLAEHPGYATNSQRLINRVALIQELEVIMKTRQRDDWIAALQNAGVPCGPINNIEQVFQNPQVKAREIWKTLPHPVAGTAPTTANPIRYSDTPIQYRMAPPLLGQHTDEILEELGLKRPQG